MWVLIGLWRIGCGLFVLVQLLSAKEMALARFMDNYVFVRF